MTRFIFSIFFLFSVLLPLEVWSDIYLYVDEQGVSHYTNVPTSSRYKPIKLGQISTMRAKSTPTLKTNTKRYAKPKHNSAQFDHHIKKAALSNMLDPLLIKAIIKAESGFDPYAVSSSGAQGLMQLMPETARDMRVHNPFDPAQNINGGTRYFRNLLNSYQGDLALSLAAYNAGPGNVAKKGPVPQIPETRKYVSRVIQFYRSYQQNAPIYRSKNIQVGELVTVN